MRKQTLIVWALAAVHNFINTYGQSLEDDEAFLNRLEDTEEDEENGGDEDDRGAATRGTENPRHLDHTAMVQFRDQLAERMWVDYQNQYHFD